MNSADRYYFHVWEQSRVHKDIEGVELPDLRAAWKEVLRVDQELRSDPAGISNMWLEVADSLNRTVLVAPVGETHEHGSGLKARP
jgi:hypothetical protein